MFPQTDITIVLLWLGINAVSMITELLFIINAFTLSNKKCKISLIKTLCDESDQI